MNIIEKILIVSAIGGVGYIVWRTLNKSGENIRTVNSWLDEIAYEALANKLKIEKATLLTGIVNRDINSLEACKKVLKEAHWIFTRKEDKVHFNASLVMTFADETKTTIDLIKHWDDIPSAVRGEFIKTGSPNMSIGWMMHDI